MSIYNHHKKYPKGEIKYITVESKYLSNAFGDPSVRRMPVYLPPGYSTSEEAYPLLCYLAAYTNSGLAMPDWRAFSESIPERLDRLIAEQKIGPVVMIFPDCFTRLGGNQYLDSDSLGGYASYIHYELVPVVEKTFRVKPGSKHRAVLGKSSGGFAAIRFAMDFPGYWSAIANHSGDAGFDILYLRDFPIVADTLRDFNYDCHRFLDSFWRSKKIMGSHILTMMHLCLAVSYDSDGSDSIDLPFNLETCEIDDVRWQKWLAHDPVNRAEKHQLHLKKLNGLFMDCGFRDQYYIHYGLRQLSNVLEKNQVEHTYQEFNGNHSGIDYRLDESLPYLYERVQ